MASVLTPSEKPCILQFVVQSLSLEFKFLGYWFIYHHATCLIFFKLWKWQEEVDIDNFACLVPLHVPTISWYSTVLNSLTYSCYYIYLFIASGFCKHIWLMRHRILSGKLHEQMFWVFLHTSSTLGLGEYICLPLQKLMFEDLRPLFESQDHVI